MRRMRLQYPMPLLERFERDEASLERGAAQRLDLFQPFLHRMSGMFAAAARDE